MLAFGRGSRWPCSARDGINATTFVAKMKPKLVIVTSRNFKAAAVVL
jgi:hypothetical protein